MAKTTTLKKSSSNLERLVKEIEKINTSSTEAREPDTRFWKLERDKSGNGSAVIRFLPTPKVDGDDGLPWVRYFDHGFKGPTGKWYIEKSLTTLGKKDPAGEYNSALWEASSDDSSPERKQAREQKRRLHYVANILVISDPKHPENEGKVFLYRFGKKIFDKISLALSPEFEGDAPIDPFDLEDGANFKLRIRTVSGFPNYDQSTFDNPSPVSGDIDSILASQHSLLELISPDKFESYDVLKNRLDEVLGLNEVATTRRVANPVENQRVTRHTLVKEEEKFPDPEDEDPEDETLEKFRALAEND